MDWNVRAILHYSYHFLQRKCKPWRKFMTFATQTRKWWTLTILAIFHNDGKSGKDGENSLFSPSFINPWNSKIHAFFANLMIEYLRVWDIYIWLIRVVDYRSFQNRITRVNRFKLIIYDYLRFAKMTITARNSKFMAKMKHYSWFPRNGKYY
jgi:hypothetical protein